MNYRGIMGSMYQESVFCFVINLYWKTLKLAKMHFLSKIRNLEKVSTSPNLKEEIILYE